MNQTMKNQTKPNQTIFHLNAKFSLISYAIFIKFGVVISITLWHITIKVSADKCMHAYLACKNVHTNYAKPKQANPIQIKPFSI